MKGISDIIAVKNGTPYFLEVKRAQTSSTSLRKKQPQRARCTR